MLSAKQQPGGQTALVGGFPRSPMVSHVGPRRGSGGMSTPLWAGDVVKSRFLGLKCSGYRSPRQFGMFLHGWDELVPPRMAGHRRHRQCSKPVPPAAPLPAPNGGFWAAALGEAASPACKQPAPVHTHLIKLSIFCNWNISHACSNTSSRVLIFI